MDYFDWKFYINLYDDLSFIKDENNALKHYILSGQNEKRICNKKDFQDFDWNFYVFLYDDISFIKDENNALKHYILLGQNEKRICNKKDFQNFDWEFYVFLNEKFILFKDENKAIKHYFLYEKKENIYLYNLKIYQNFDYDNYINSNKDLKNINNKKDAYIHFIKYGINENRINNNFDWEFYINFYKDINYIKNKKDAFQHYLKIGIKKNRIYNKKILEYFDYDNYILSFKNQIKFINKEEALKHFINEGILEYKIYNHEIYNLFDSEFYKLLYNDVIYIEDKYNLYNHYILIGINQNRIFCKTQNIYYIIKNIEFKINYQDFDYEFYTSLYNDLLYIKTKKEAFIHWLKNKDIEERFCDKEVYTELTKFDYEYYLKLNENIKNEINTEEKAYKHWIYIKNEKKNLNNINKNLNDMDTNNVLNNDVNNNHDNKIKNEKEKINNFNTFITFIIPTIGRESLLNTISSLENLNNSDWSAIILFDGIKNNFEINNEKILIIEIEKKGELNTYNRAGEVRNIGFKYINNSEWIGFVDDDDLLSSDYIDKLKEEIEINNKIDVCIFRMIYENKIVIPDYYDRNIAKCRVGISFALKSHITQSIVFYNNQFEDYYFLKELEYKNHNIVISPYICYFVKSEIFNITNIYDRVYI